MTLYREIRCASRTMAHLPRFATVNAMTIPAIARPHVLGSGITRNSMLSKSNRSTP